ncbi:MAG: nucleotidyl transferase AbiEii/AbiGii toxin family protein [Planctomycetes bacterium]|nr:nucleotidyl transferase AbiEii/AbiGii toxin family protein [Planctomycetota bacterium]
MTERAPKNVAASVHQRLKDEAKASGRTFNDLLQHYALERFLFRLSKSAYADRFVLKGALLLRVWRLSSIRPTRDIDLLGEMSNEVEAIEATVRDVCEIPIEDDGLSFDGASVRATPITEDADYEGLRVEFDGALGNARIRMQIDIGFGDRITPGPEEIEYPTVLDMEPPRLRAYPPETSIAEKFQVMLYRGVLNSRMKDYFDIWTLARSRAFDGAVLAEAVRATCERRGTPVEAEPVAFSDEMMADRAKQAQWAAFRRRLRPTDAPESFADVVTAVARFLAPVAEAVAVGISLESRWEPGGPWA